VFRVDNQGLVVLEVMAVIVTSRELPPREQTSPYRRPQECNRSPVRCHSNINLPTFRRRHSQEAILMASANNVNGTGTCQWTKNQAHSTPTHPIWTHHDTFRHDIDLLFRGYLLAPSLPASPGSVFTSSGAPERRTFSCLSA
jgi:hypothetical protein